MTRRVLPVLGTLKNVSGFCGSTAFLFPCTTVGDAKDPSLESVRPQHTLLRLALLAGEATAKGHTRKRRENHLGSIRCRGSVRHDCL